MQRPGNWPSASEVEAVKRMGGGCRLVAECYEWLLSQVHPSMTRPCTTRCSKCHGCVEGGHERDGSGLCWCSHSETEAEVQSEA